MRYTQGDPVGKIVVLSRGAHTFMQHPQLEQLPDGSTAIIFNSFFIFELLRMVGISTLPDGERNGDSTYNGAEFAVKHASSEVLSKVQDAFSKRGSRLDQGMKVLIASELNKRLPS